MTEFTQHDLDMIETLLIDYQGYIDTAETLSEEYRRKRVDELGALLVKVERLVQGQGSRIPWEMDRQKLQTTESKAFLEALREIAHQLARMNALLEEDRNVDDRD